MSLTPESAISWKICERAREDKGGQRGRVAKRREGGEGGRESRAHVLHLLLLSLGEVEHLSSVLEENGSLGLSLGDIESTGIDGDLQLESLLDDT